MNDRIFSYFGVTPESERWLDWKWQYKNRITTVDALAGALALSGEEKAQIADCANRFKMSITPYFASVIDPDDPCCPIRMQAVPSAEEMRVFPWEKKDPLDEERDSTAPHIIHRYPDRALFLVTGMCAMFCRHCVRKRFFDEDGFIADETGIEHALEYIRKTPAIRDVLISGGDPLVLDDGRLEDIISRIRAIDHVEIIRIGSRAPATLPMRITHNLMSMLKKYQPIWINTQFNHPRELTPQAVRACADIVDAGVPLGNQSVLLRNVNDNTATMKELLLGLVKARVRPYYIYQCDLCEGAEHFRTRVETGLNIIKELTGNISGYAIPRFVVDAPGGGGKIPVEPQNIVSLSDEAAILTNYLGREYTYPQIPNPDC